MVAKERSLKLIDADVSCNTPVVGKSYKIGNKYFRYSYKEANKHKKNGWIDKDSYLPLQLDLVELKDEDGKIYKGWLTSKNKWCGLHFKKDTKIIAWKEVENLYAPEKRFKQKNDQQEYPKVN